MADTLFDRGPRERWRGSTALAVRRSVTTCPSCGTPGTTRTHTQIPLAFLHGGYGAAQRRTSTICDCGVLAVVSLETVNPRSV
jgi:hypothetical protein